MMMTMMTRQTRRWSTVPSKSKTKSKSRTRSTIDTTFQLILTVLVILGYVVRSSDGFTTGSTAAVRRRGAAARDGRPRHVYDNNYGADGTYGRDGTASVFRLSMNFRDFFNGDDFANFFGNDKNDNDDKDGEDKIGKKKGGDDPKKSSSSTNNSNAPNNVSSKIAYDDFRDEYDEEEEEYDDDFGTTPIFTIPAKSIKIGGLRLYLSLHFMGIQNTPTKNAWRTDQSPDGKSLTLYYKDRTAALVLSFSDSEGEEGEMGLAVRRLGSRPSMDYLMVEGEVLGGVLDVLEEIATDGSIGVEDRLLCLGEEGEGGDVIGKVREYLAFS